jgi:hypothetical protein
VTIDAWDPKTFGDEITAALTDHSRLVLDYRLEDERLWDEHLNSSPHQSLKPNRYFSAYQELREKKLAPILAKSRIRAWHYTRLTDEEADAMRKQLVLTSLDFLRSRLSNLVEKNLLTQVDSDTVFVQSPFHKQLEIRAGQLCTTDIPLPHCYGGVVPLLESWGGESAYFWLSDERIATKLKKVGVPRIVEIETALSDNRNGCQVAETVLNAWTRRLGIQATRSGCDLFITKCIDTAKVIRIHTEGDGCFEAVATVYPENVGALLDEPE